MVCHLKLILIAVGILLFNILFSVCYTQDTPNVIHVNKVIDKTLGFIKVNVLYGEDRGSKAFVSVQLESKAILGLNQISEGVFYIEIPQSQQGKVLTIETSLYGKKRRYKVILKEMGDFEIIDVNYRKVKVRTQKAKKIKSIPCEDFE